jgi:DNA-binding LytR/AlgR family response regulator
MTMTITAIIAEDEHLLRADLKKLLNSLWPELDIVAEAEDGAEALEVISAHKPNVAFLDIRMPGLTGLDVAAALKETSAATQIVFVTAYQQHAIEAFEKGAIDYVLKPIDATRLSATIDRLKTRADKGVSGDALASVMQQLATQMCATREPLTWVSASAGKETKLIIIDDVHYFQADNKYTVVMTAEGEALIKKPIKELLDELDGNTFKQVHRSTIVNLRAIKSIARDDTGKGLIKFKGSTQTVQVSQPFMHLFRNM